MHYTFAFSEILAAWPQLAIGLLVTAGLSLCAIAAGFVLGTLCAIARIQRIPVFGVLADVYVESVRNTPFLIQAFLVFFGLSSLGLRLDANTCAILALTLNAGAYACEIMRAGFQSIQKGQVEAAESLGMPRHLVYWHVLLLPATLKVFPALASQFVLVMLSSSITSQISAEELTGVANIIQSETFRSLEVYLVVGALYLFLSLCLRALFAWIHRQLTHGRRNAT